MTLRPAGPDGLPVPGPEPNQNLVPLGGVAPYAASWMGGDPAIVRAALRDRIGETYALLAIEPADFGLGNVPSDHVGILLALLAVATQRDPSEGGVGARTRELLTPWGSAFADGLDAKAESPLYRAAARLLAEVLQAGG